MKAITRYDMGSYFLSDTDETILATLISVLLAILGDQEWTIGLYQGGAIGKI